jgi:bifunctional DNase/RNase
MVEVTIDRVLGSLMSEHRIIVLKEINSERHLPIWIGPYEAEAIVIRLQDRVIARPLTHDLLTNVIAEMGGEIAHVVVSEMRDDTYFARIVVDLNGRRLEIDSRPSDAIALAVRANVPIFVEEAVMALAIVPETDITEEAEVKDLSAFREFVDKLNLDLPVQ